MSGCFQLRDAPRSRGRLTVRELQELPDSLLELFVAFLDLVEEVGEWPEQLLVAMVSLIPKGEGTQPLDLRFGPAIDSTFM